MVHVAPTGLAPVSQWLEGIQYRRSFICGFGEGEVGRNGVVHPSYFLSILLPVHAPPGLCPRGAFAFGRLEKIFFFI